MTTLIQQTTTIRYQDFDVTIIGELDAGLLTIAGFGTPQERAIAVIAVQQRGARRTYRLAEGGRAGHPASSRPPWRRFACEATDQGEREGT